VRQPGESLLRLYDLSGEDAAPQSRARWKYLLGMLCYRLARRAGARAASLKKQLGQRGRARPGKSVSPGSDSDEEEDHLSNAEEMRQAIRSSHLTRRILLLKAEQLLRDASQDVSEPSRDGQLHPPTSMMSVLLATVSDERAEAYEHKASQMRPSTSVAPEAFSLGSTPSPRGSDGNERIAAWDQSLSEVDALNMAARCYLQSLEYWSHVQQSAPAAEAAASEEEGETEGDLFAVSEAGIDGATESVVRVGARLADCLLEERQPRLALRVMDDAVRVHHARQDAGQWDHLFQNVSPTVLATLLLRTGDACRALQPGSEEPFSPSTYRALFLTVWAVCERISRGELSVFDPSVPPPRLLDWSTFPDAIATICRDWRQDCSVPCSEADLDRAAFTAAEFTGWSLGCFEGAVALLREREEPTLLEGANQRAGAAWNDYGRAIMARQLSPPWSSNVPVAASSVFSRAERFLRATSDVTNTLLVQCNLSVAMRQSALAVVEPLLELPPEQWWEGAVAGMGLTAAAGGVARQELAAHAPHVLAQCHASIVREILGGETVDTDLSIASPPTLPPQLSSPASRRVRSTKEIVLLVEAWSAASMVAAATLPRFVDLARESATLTQESILCKVAASEAVQACAGYSWIHSVTGSPDALWKVACSWFQSAQAQRALSQAIQRRDSRPEMQIASAMEACSAFHRAAEALSRVPCFPDELTMAVARTAPDSSVSMATQSLNVLAMCCTGLVELFSSKGPIPDPVLLLTLAHTALAGWSKGLMLFLLLSRAQDETWRTACLPKKPSEKRRGRKGGPTSSSSTRELPHWMRATHAFVARLLAPVLDEWPGPRTAPVRSLSGALSALPPWSNSLTADGVEGLEAAVGALATAAAAASHELRVRSARRS
jgi:hypothetical protein